MTGDQPTRAASRPRRAVDGFLLGAIAFLLVSVAAYPVGQALSPHLCSIHLPAQRFPGFACTIVSATAAALWLGPVGLIVHGLGWDSPNVTTVRLASAGGVGLVAAALVGRLGMRRGLIAFLIVSGAAALVETVLLIPALVF